MTKIPTVALVGKVNVGKSSLFNKLHGERKALESPIAGTTRDYNQAIIYWRDKIFNLIDTGGFLPDKPETETDRETVKLAKEQAKQSQLAVLVVDHKEGLTPFDKELFEFLKKSGLPFIIAVNKVDKPKDWQNSILEFAELGHDKIIPVSAATGKGTGDLLDLIASLLPTTNKQNLKPEESNKLKNPEIKLAIVGQPNVGKSSLLNAIVGQKRALTSPIPHTTRDAHDEIITYKNQIIQIIDTAGIRRRKKKSDLIEKFSIDLSLKNLRHSNIALLVLDISQRITYQDKHLAEKLIETGNSVIIIANKWDLIPDKETNTINEYREYIHAQLPYLTWAPIIFTSAINGQRIFTILDKALEIWQERFRRIDDNALDKFIKRIIKIHKPSRDKGVAHPYIYRLRQAGVNPPNFELTIKYQKSLHSSYLRFIQNQLRDKFGFTGTPIKIYVKALK